MSSSSTGLFHQKTTAELQFFIDNPAQYHPSLVDAARAELRRRGVLPAPGPVLFEPSEDVVSEEFSTTRPWARGMALVAVVGLLGGGAYWLQQHGQVEAATRQAREATRLRLHPPRLSEAPSSALPNYEGVVMRCVQRQVQQVPAAERAAAARATQPMRQYRELAKRFWTAETQTEYLTSQAYTGQAGPLWAEQALLVRETWRAWNQAAAYSYRFGPAMTAHLDRMAQAASSQQHILADLPDLLPDRRFLTNKELMSREADVQDLLAGLVPVSPVTGQVYRIKVLKVKL